MKKIFIFSLTTIFHLSCSKEVENKYKVLLQSVTENTLGKKIDFLDSNEAITSAIRVIQSKKVLEYICMKLYRLFI